MFELFVFACMTQEIKCFMIIDEYAPYKTKQECMNRVSEIYKNLPTETKFKVLPIEFFCKKINSI